MSHRTQSPRAGPSVEGSLGSSVDRIHGEEPTESERPSERGRSHDPRTCGVPSERPALHNGQLLVDLTASSLWWEEGFDLQSCEERLANSGVQVPLEDYELPIRRSLMIGKVRRYMYFSSPGFSMILAPTFYLITWCSLFSTLHQYLSQYVRTFFWGFCLLISLASVVLTTGLLLTLGLHHKKINMNTDGRLIWANENLWKHNVLVGLLVSTKHCSSLLHLCFIYFNVQPCEQTLASLLDEKRWTVPTLQAYLRRKLGSLSVVLETSPAQPLEGGEAPDTEASPLLPRNTPRVQSRRQPMVTLNTVKSLIPVGTSQEMAHQLMAVYSGLYVRLLASDQLPPTLHSLHAPQARVPCLCQYIQTTVLQLDPVVCLP